ncbi:IPT/TIG domain-containing protein [Nocardia brevicatena]|uniref:IPT/TIG domain-containing protein n=1 Tax=Nocardia brevicatena TaxID=37327 RepID=UPI0034D70D9F
MERAGRYQCRATAWCSREVSPATRRQPHAYHHCHLPNFRAHDGGTSVTITGTGFTGPTTVRFDSTATTFTLDSPTQITAIAPTGPTGTVQVTVIGSGGTSNGSPIHMRRSPP